MFEKIKQIQQLKSLQNQIKQQRVEVEKDGVKVILTGELEVVSLALNPSLDMKAQERALMYCLNEARNQMQKTLAKNLAGQLF